MTDIAPCATCGAPTPLDQLDAKPRSLQGRPATEDKLSQAADRGEDFDVLECRGCYGPAWLPAAEQERGGE